MKHKLLVLCIFIILVASLLCGCDAALNSLLGTTEETVAEEVIPMGAVFPVMADEAKGVKSREIQLSDFTFMIPEGYVYGKVDYENYSIYYVWQDKADKEYALELDMDNMLYIYDGLDVFSPHQLITESEALRSITGAYIGNFRTLVTGKNFNVDPSVVYSSDERYYIASFEGRSGDYLTTTYSSVCYPKTYYGIYGVERRTVTSDRRYYGFIFSNDARGEIFTKSEYESLLGQVKEALSIEKLYTLHNADSVFYDPATDVSNGRSYEQLVGAAETESTSEIRGLFSDTFLYYVETIGRSYERENVDGGKIEEPKDTEPSAPAPESKETIPLETESADVAATELTSADLEPSVPIKSEGEIQP